LRRFVRLELPRAEATAAASDAFAESFARARRAWSTPSVEALSRLELGQGEVWMLLATPCGTGAESDEDAGLLSLAVRAIAEKNPKIHGVDLEPWITPDGIGLLAHAPRRAATETATALAYRVGTALGRALAGARLTEDDAAAARAILQTEIGPERGVLWDVAYDALSPGHVSVLDARGTWDAVTRHSTHATDLERRAFIRGPLRVAVIANADPSQVGTATGALERWLRPIRTGPIACTPIATPTARLGEYAVETDDAPKQGGRALVAVSFTPSPLRGVPREAEWTLYLLNRPGGWLDSALRKPGLATETRATLISFLSSEDLSKSATNATTFLNSLSPISFSSTGFCARQVGHQVA
jgi:hypothetical protein